MPCDIIRHRPVKSQKSLGKPVSVSRPVHVGLLARSCRSPDRHVCENGSPDPIILRNYPFVYYNRIRDPDTQSCGFGKPQERCFGNENKSSFPVHVGLLARSCRSPDRHVCENGSPDPIILRNYPFVYYNRIRDPDTQSCGFGKPQERCFGNENKS